VYANGTRLWYLNGKKHREDGPALERADGNKYWWVNGKEHREEGPAIERSDGTREWYLNNSRFLEEEFTKKAKNKKFTASEKESLKSYGIEVG
jgi:hypothetical protein